ncbi:hypothetical protein [Mesorhizobium sp.]|nr:hypothetical protein [Mesorhizobium sp.]
MADDKCNKGSGAETASRVTKNMSSAIATKFGLSIPQDPRRQAR